MKYKIADLGTFESGALDPEIIAIYNNDLDKLKQLLGNKINKVLKIKADEYSEKFTPLAMALYLNKKDIIYWLLANNASGSYIAIAVRYCEPDVVALFEKDLQNMSDEQKEHLFEEIFWGKNKMDNITALEKMGVSIAKFGGAMFRILASDGDLKMAKYFVEKGVDINFHKADSIYPYASTPVLEAARENNFAMVKFLVENGADITLKDKYADRPYSVAVKNNNKKMAEFLAKHEPADFHNIENKHLALKSYKLPKKLTEFLQSDNLIIPIKDNAYCQFIRFYAYLDTVEMKWKNKKVLSLVAELDNYDVFFVWYPAKNMIYVIDYEHETFTPLASWDDFSADIESYVNAYLNGSLTPIND